MFDPDRFLEQWNRQADVLLDDALRFLGAVAERPFSDGVLRDWIRQLSSFRFKPDHVLAIVTLIEKDDPYLQEAGIELAAAATEHVVELGLEIEQPLARLLRNPLVDKWVLHACVKLLGKFIGPQGPQLADAYRELVHWLESPPVEKEPQARPAIARTMYINPRGELIELLEQHALQTLAPTDRIEIILPVLEKQHGTSGWLATLNKILESKGLNPEEHEAALQK